MRTYLFVLSTLLLLSPKNGQAQPIKKLKGNWASENAENLGTAYGYREFSFNKNQWEIKFTMYGDQAMTYPLFTFRAVGDYTLGKSSGQAEGAQPAVFRFSKKFVTLKADNPDVIKNLGFAECGLQKDVEKEITSTGCSFLVSNAACAQEYDLVAIKDGKLYFGNRPADGNMCTEDKRPTAVGLPLVKK